MPIAASLSPLAAVGAVWLGMVGGGFPDWFDLRSDFSSRLKHRGMSHSLFVGMAFAVAVYLILQLVVNQFAAISLNESNVRSLAMAFAAGFLSHILADACTHAGVRMLLPVVQDRFWILPPPLRGKSSGIIDTIARFIALVLVLFSLWEVVQSRIG